MLILTPSPIGASPVRSVLLVDILCRRKKGLRFEATSLPGHLIHLVISGCVRQECNGRAYTLRRGCVIWYHEDELVRGTVLQSPWRFYTVNFSAPSLPPPSFETRLFRNRMGLLPFFDVLFKSWNNHHGPSAVREFKVHAALLEILAGLAILPRQNMQMEDKGRPWWELETQLRRNLAQPINLKMMSKLAKRSQATIGRSCFQAVGMSPMRRIKQIRMSLARGLVKHSTLTMTEIADRAGFPRVHEFSRDYRKHFKITPTSDRGCYSNSHSPHK